MRRRGLACSKRGKSHQSNKGNPQGALHIQLLFPLIRASLLISAKRRLAPFGENQFEDGMGGYTVGLNARTRAIGGDGTKT